MRSIIAAVSGLSARLRRTALLLGIWLGLLASPAGAVVAVPADLQSLQLRPQVEYLEDASAQLTIDDVVALAKSGRFTRVQGSGDLNLGFTPSALWVRLVLRSDSEQPLDTLLEVAYPQLDRVEFHTVDMPGQVPLSSGDTLPFSARPWQHRNIVFPLRLEPGQVQTVYLRVVSRGSLTVPLKLWSPRALQDHDQWAYAAHALYFGVLLTLGIYNLLLFASVRDRIHLAYVANLATFALGMLGVLGFGHQFLFPELPQAADKLPLFGLSLYGFFALMFVRAFLQTRAWGPRMDLALKVVAFTALATSLGVFATDSGPFVKMIAVLAPVASMCSLLAGLAALHKGQPGARIFVFASLVFQFGLTAYGLRALDLVPSNALTSYGIQWGSVIEMMLLSLALADRIQALRHEKERAQAEALRARRSAVEALQDAEKRLEDRIAERTAELARANEHLLASQRELSRLALHDGLTGLANRAHLEEQLLLAVARCRRAGTGCAVLLIDLDGFKAVNDTRGHAVGDALLKSVADRLRSQVRASDLVARVGGDEFVVVFEPAETEALAVSLSRKLLDALGKPHRVADEVFTVGASIGIALVPAHGTEPKELLERADRAMYEAKRRGKGCFEVARPVA